MARKRTPIKLNPASLIVTSILSWATYHSVIELLFEVP